MSFNSGFQEKINNNTAFRIVGTYRTLGKDKTEGYMVMYENSYKITPQSIAEVKNVINKGYKFYNAKINSQGSIENTEVEMSKLPIWEVNPQTGIFTLKKRLESLGQYILGAIYAQGTTDIIGYRTLNGNMSVRDWSAGQFINYVRAYGMHIMNAQIANKQKQTGRKPTTNWGDFILVGQKGTNRPLVQIDSARWEVTSAGQFVYDFPVAQ